MVDSIESKVDKLDSMIAPNAHVYRKASEQILKTSHRKASTVCAHASKAKLALQKAMAATGTQAPKQQDKASKAYNLKFEAANAAVRGFVLQFPDDDAETLCAGLGNLLTDCRIEGVDGTSASASGS